MKSGFLGRMSALIGRRAIWLAIPAAVLLFAAIFSNAQDFRWHGGANETLVGTWITNAQLSVIPPGFPTDGQFQAIETFNADGTMFVVSQIPGVSIGNGVWKATGSNTYTFTFTFYRPDVSSPAKMLPVLVNENVKIVNHDAYQTTDVIEPLDAAGNPLNICGGICQFPGRVNAIRYPFQSYNRTLP